MQPRCWAKRCTGDFFILKDDHKANTLRPEPVLLFWAWNSWGEDEFLSKSMWHHFKWIFTTLLALLRCCNSSSWSWTGESVHLELGRRSLKRLMVQLVKFLHLKVPKYSGNVSKRKFEGVLFQAIFEPFPCSKAGPTKSLLLRKFGISRGFWKARQVMHLSA